MGKTKINARVDSYGLTEVFSFEELRLLLGLDTRVFERVELKGAIVNASTRHAVLSFEAWVKCESVVLRIDALNVKLEVVPESITFNGTGRCDIVFIARD